MRKTKYQFGWIHNWTEPISFDIDLFSIDKVYYEFDDVVYAERIFYIPSPNWLRYLVFGPIVTKRMQE